MFFLAWGGLLRKALNHSFQGASTRTRRQFRGSFSRAAAVLEARVLPAATPVGPVINVGLSAPGGTELVSQSTRSIATAPDGDFVVTWIRGGTGGGILAQRFHANGAPDGGEFLVSSSPETGYSATGQEDPAVAMNASGEFVITWQNLREDYTSINRNVYARRYDANGVAQGEEFLVHADVDGYRFAAEVAIDDDGSFAVVWNLFNLGSDDSQAFVRRYDSAGVAFGNEAAVAYSAFVAWPDIAYLPDGGFVLSFSDETSLLTTRFDSGGNPVGSPSFVRDSRFINSSAIAVDASGDYVVTWSENDMLSTYQHVYARRFLADGTAAGSAFVVSSSELHHVDSSPSVAMSPEGHFVVTWTSGTGAERDVLARAFNADSVPLGEDFLVTPIAEGEQAYSSVAMTATGEFIINWNDRVDFDVQAQRFLLNLIPTDITLDSDSIAEDAEVGTVVGTLSGVDADGDQSFVFELVSGAGDDDNAAFQIAGDELQTNATFDFESKTSYTIRVRATDLTGASVEKTLTIQVTNVLEPSVVTLSNDSVDENLPRNTLVGLLGLTDAPEGSIQYRFVGGAGASGNGKFKISGDQLLTKAGFNFEKQSSYSVRVQARDSEGNVSIQVLTIQIGDVADGPTSIALSNSTVLGNKRSGTTVGRLTALDPTVGERFQFTLVGGAVDNAQFRLRGNVLQTNARFDAEVQSSYTVRIRVTDRDGLWFEQDFTISIL